MGPAPRGNVGWGFLSSRQNRLSLSSPSFRRGVARTARRSTCHCPMRVRIANSSLANPAQKHRKERPFPTGRRRKSAGRGVYRCQSRRVRSPASRPPSVPAGSYLDGARGRVLPLLRFPAGLDEGSRCLRATDSGRFDALAEVVWPSPELEAYYEPTSAARRPPFGRNVRPGA
jgi:hypothetical protein